MERKDSVDAFGLVAMIGFATIFALNQVVIKVTGGGFGPVFMAGLRSLGALGVLLLWMRWRGVRLETPPGALWGGMLAGVLFSVEFTCLFTALDLTTVARASIIFYSMPVWLALAAHFLLPADRLNSVRALGMALAMGGVALALFDRSGAEGNLTGDLLALVGAMCWAGIALTARITPLSQARPEVQLYWQVLVSAPILLAISPFMGDLLREVAWIHIAGLAFQIVCVASLGFLMWFWLLSIYPASSVASFSFLSPVLAVLFGWLLLGETIGAEIWVALALVAAGLVLINRR
ncbi:DMT family transporter [Thalassococcus sp. S3]|uniref:DMT family transporter n=1 Tax=Thalassococcus sp. S3 TaxID=2017482 RepID=UPI0010244EF1|nr:DMT family transporter [Thalassococcus sp. S3]QBF31607.1 EamA family transporter [Thalassococcus sp. S3]